MAVQCCRSEGMARAAEPLLVVLPVLAVVVAAEPVDVEAVPLALAEVGAAVLVEAEEASEAEVVVEGDEADVAAEAVDAVEADTEADDAVDAGTVPADVAPPLFAAVPLPAQPARIRTSAKDAARRLRCSTDFSLRRQQSAATVECKKSAGSWT